MTFISFRSESLYLMALKTCRKQRLIVAFGQTLWAVQIWPRSLSIFMTTELMLEFFKLASLLLCIVTYHSCIAIFLDSSIIANTSSPSRFVLKVESTKMYLESVECRWHPGIFGKLGH
jgi:hypothetical protein